MARAGAPFSSSGVGIRFFHHIYWRSYLAPCLWGIILSKLKEVNSRTRRESCTFSRHGSRSVQQRSRLTGHQHPSPYAFWLWIPRDLGYHVTGCLKLFLPWLSQHDGLSHGTLSPNKTLLLLSGYIVTARKLANTYISLQSPNLLLLFLHIHRAIDAWVNKTFIFILTAIDIKLTWMRPLSYLSYKSLYDHKGVLSPMRYALKQLYITYKL